MKKISLLAISAFLVINANAQNKWDKDTDVFIDIDGMELYTSPTRVELEKHFGTAVLDKYIEEDMGNYYLLEYEGVKIFIEENGCMSGFEIESSKYPVLTLYGLGEGIRVGDRWEKFLSSNYPVHSIYETKGYIDGGIWQNVVMWYKNDIFDHITSFYVVNGVITKITSGPVEW